MVLTVLVFNVLAFLSFYGLVGAVLVAIHRGMGVHKNVIEYDRGVAGMSAYRQVRSMPFQRCSARCWPWFITSSFYPGVLTKYAGYLCLGHILQPHARYDQAERLVPLSADPPRRAVNSTANHCLGCVWDHSREYVCQHPCRRVPMPPYQSRLGQLTHPRTDPVSFCPVKFKH
jgi:hypothetical protein